MSDRPTTQQQSIRVRRLGPYIVYAAALHAALMALGMLRAARAETPEPPAMSRFTAMTFDVEAAPPPPATPPGGGSPFTGDSSKPVVQAPVHVAVAKIASGPSKPAKPSDAPTQAQGLAEPVDEASKEAPAPTDQDTESGMTASHAADERRERDLAMSAAASAAGAGRGTGGGPGGSGSGWGNAPPIRGATAFGNGSHGALTGRVCFIPVGTMRIADVHHCDYVATMYTDTLNIPERQYYDGFPGVSDRSDWFLVDYTGSFTVSEFGWFRFRIHSDDGSMVYIDDTLLIDNDGKHAPESRTGTVQLGPGTHSIFVRYAQTTDRMALQLFVQVPQTTFEILFGPHI